MKTMQSKTVCQEAEVKNVESILDLLCFFDKPEKIIDNLKEIRKNELPIIENNIKAVITNEYDLKSFLEIYDISWNLHNSFDAEITNAYDELIKIGSTPAGVELLRKLLITSIKIDRTKRITSNSLKEVIVNYCNRNKITPIDMQKILVPSNPTFYFEYYKDMAGMKLQAFADKYCRGSIKLAEYYIQQEKGLLGDIRFDRLRANIPPHLSNDKIDYESISTLLYKDNYEEYLFKYQLVGVGDYLLHKIAADLTSVDISYFDMKVEALTAISTKIAHYFKYKIPKFKQTEYNCATACLLNGISGLKNINPTRKLEAEISNIIRAFPNKTATLPTLLAEVAANHFGIRATILFEKTDYLSNNEAAVEKSYFNAFMERLRSTQARATAAGAKIIIENIDNLTIRKRLASGPVIVATWEGITHYVLVYGYDDNSKLFFIFDPIQGGKMIKYEVFSDYVTTPFGKWAIHLENNYENLLTIASLYKNKIQAFQKSYHEFCNLTSKSYAS